MRKFIVLKYGNGAYLGIDHQAGGFPYKCDIEDAYKWYIDEDPAEKELAIRYMNMFSSTEHVRDNGGLSICEVTL